MKMIKEIRKILSDAHPECEVDGHRVHTTLGDADWPDWGVFVYGIGGGFVHFEFEEDGHSWRKKHDELAETMNKEDDSISNSDFGRCVSECGPIGFGAYMDTITEEVA